MGNRMTLTEDSVATTYAYNNADQLTSTTRNSVTTPYTWDNNGNMLTKGSQTFTWDRANRLSGLTNGSTTASYRYNGDGVRLGKTVDGVITDYLQDQSSGLSVVVSETAGAETHTYVYGSDLIAANSSAWSFYHTDGLGSTRLLTDAAGAMTDQYSYDAFGEIRSHSGTSNQDFLYTGALLGDENSLYSMGDRSYDAFIGRFTSKDFIDGSMMHPQSWNKYVYVYSNPINLIDPSGLWGISPRINVGAAGGLLGGGDISGGIGPEFEFQSWNPLDWKFGIGVGGTLKAKTGPYGELSPTASASLYVWDRKAPIPGASDAPITSCLGGGGSLGIGVNAGACTGNDKTGFKLGASLSASGGAYGYGSVGVGKSWTTSPRELLDSVVSLYNYFFSNQDQTRDYYIGGGFGGGGGGAWGLPPSSGK